MRSRIRPALLPLLPLAVAGLYALAYGFLAPTPTATTVAPGETILTERFRDLATLDAVLQAPGDAVPPSERIGADLNAPGLPGVARHRPILRHLLPPQGRADATITVLPLEDAGRFRRRFEDPSLFDQGHRRRARHLEIRGAWAAVGWDREAVRRLGEGGLVPEDRGEDHAVAFRVRAMVEVALYEPSRPPWASVLEMFGAEPAAATPAFDPETGLPEVRFAAGRIHRVHESWDRASFWSWRAKGRLEAELWPAPGTLVARALARAVATPEGAPSRPAPRAPARASAWLRVADEGALRTLGAALHAAGVRLPEALEEDDERAAGWFLGEGESGSGILLWAEPALAHEGAWTVAVAAHGTLPDLRTPLSFLPEEGGSLSLAEGALPLTLPDPAARGPAPAGEAVRTNAGGIAFLALGPDAAPLVARAPAALAAAEQVRADSVEEAAAPRERLLATFGLAGPWAARILGSALAPGGLLAPLAGSDLAGAVWTDGARIRIVVARAR